MTRVEKYRTYREEIANMKFQSSSSKKTVSEKVGSLRNIYSGSKLQYEEVLNAYEVYDSDAKDVKKRRIIKLRKTQIIYLVIACSVVLGLLIGVIISGVNL